MTFVTSSSVSSGKHGIVSTRAVAESVCGRDAAAHRRYSRPCGLAVIGDGVVDISTDVPGCQLTTEYFAVFTCNYIEMSDILVSANRRKSQRQTGEFGGVARGNGASARVPAIEMRQQIEQKCRLNLIQTAVFSTQNAAFVAFFPSVMAQLAHPSGDRGIAGDHSSRISGRHSSSGKS